MKRAWILRLLVLVSLAVPGVPGGPGFTAPEARAAEAQLPMPALETLPNGLTVAWFANDSLPVVDLTLLVMSGYRDDPAGKSGTADLLAASLDRGAGGKSAQELARAIEALGATRYASADDDTFSIGLHGLAPDAPALLDILARIALHPDFPQAEVAREHARALDRWRHVADYGESLAMLAYQRRIAAGTPYGRGSFLSAREFAKVSRADVAAFHSRHFRPGNSVLMVVGRVDRPEFRKEILKLFGTPEAWQGAAPPKRARQQWSDRRLPKAQDALLLVDRPSLTQAQVRLGFRAPAIQVPEHYALVVGNALLGEYFGSRLNSLLRDKLGLTYGISSQFAYSKDLATFTVSSSTQNESVGELLRRTIGVLRDLKKGPIAESEVLMAKEYLEGSFPIGTATLGAVAGRWLAGYIHGLGPGYLNEFIPKVRSVTSEQVLAAMAKDLDLDHLVIAVAGDAREIRPSLQKAGFKNVAKVGLGDLL